jgi:hypothetical protein
MADKRARCSCGCLEGELHEYGCDLARCPFCGGQENGCDCRYKKLGVKVDRSALFSGLPEEVYRNGLNEQQRARWHELLEEKGRVPFIRYPSVCARCGALWPEMFMVPAWEWERYVEPAMQDAVLCRACFDTIKALVDEHAGLPEPVMVLCPECRGNKVLGTPPRPLKCPECRGQGEIAESQVPRWEAHQQQLANLRTRLEQEK